MAKVKVESYQLRVNNSEDETRKYDIACSLNVNNNEVTNIDSGNVIKDGVSVADFNRWDATNLNVTYRGITAEEQCAVNNAINEFIKNATTTAGKASLNYNLTEE